MKNPFRFKAIETFYNNYRFRSRLEFFPQDEDEGMDDNCLWGECENCSAFQLGTPYGGIHYCNTSVVGELSFDTPRLIEAYAASRQARFEHRKGRSEATV